MSDWRHFPPGGDHPNAKFDNAEREEIRTRLASGEGVRELAREKNCWPGTISKIRREKKGKV